jgi:hypothetical protein
LIIVWWHLLARGHVFAGEVAALGEREGELVDQVGGRVERGVARVLAAIGRGRVHEGAPAVWGPTHESSQVNPRVRAGDAVISTG